MLYLLPNKRGVEIPSTIMKRIAQTIDPNATILFGEEATTPNAVQAITSLNPPYIFTTGHGLPCATTLQDNQPFVSLARPDMEPTICDKNRNLSLFKGRVVHLHSCWCGKLLAPSLVKDYGATAVFAHDDEFLFLMPEDGRTIDILVAAPFLAEFTVDVTMLSGGTTGEAQAERKKAYDKWIEYFTKGKGANMDGAPLVVRILQADQLISQLYGSTSAAVTEPSTPPQVSLDLPITAEGASNISMMVIALPLLAIMFRGKSHG